MKRWLLVLDAIVVLSFALIGSDFHGFSFDLLEVLDVATPFLVALALAVVVVRAWQTPTSLLTGFLLAVITLVVGMALRRFVWGGGTAGAFVLVTAAYLIALMVGWRLVLLGAARIAGAARSPR